LKVPFVRLGTKFISEYDKLCCLMKFLRLVDNMATNAEISETPKHDFVFSCSRSRLLLLLRFSVHLTRDHGCVFLGFGSPRACLAAAKHTAAWSVCQPGWRAPETPETLLSPEVVSSLPRTVPPVEAGEGAHLRLCMVLQTEKLCSLRSAKVTSSTVTWFTVSFPGQ